MARASSSPYAVHPTVEKTVAWIRSLKESTGRSLDEWLAHVRAHGPATEVKRRAWLKEEFDLGTNTAWWLAARASGGDDAWDSAQGYLAQAPRMVEGMYRGKEALRPLHDALVEAARGLGRDVRVCPCATIVPFYRTHVFAQIKPATKTRIDLGLALGPLVKAHESLPARLLDTGGFAKKDRITHRIPMQGPAEIDAFARRWLKRAYALDAPA